jgi:hypothetical protein
MPINLPPEIARRVAANLVDDIDNRVGEHDSHQHVSESA